MLSSLDVAMGLGEDTLLWPGECPQQQGRAASILRSPHCPAGCPGGGNTKGCGGLQAMSTRWTA